MCMLTPFPTTIPEETRRLVEPLLPRDSVYRLVGAKIDEIMSDEDFIDLYAEEGRPAVNPVVLALVSVFQFLEMLPDRAAAKAAVMRLDWKYALRQELNWTGFHYSDLSNFRKRLLAHAREEVVFDRIVGYLREHGYIRGRGKQRTDATHVWARSPDWAGSNWCGRPSYWLGTRFGSGLGARAGTQIGICRPQTAPIAWDIS
jgi:transposase